MTDYKKSTKGEIIKICLICIFVFGIGGGIFYFFENLTYVIYNEQINLVCTDYGYNKATDSRYVYPREKSSPGVYLFIECDNKVIKNRNTDEWRTNMFEVKIIGETWCSSYDKWGDCKFHDSNKTKIIVH